MEMFLSLAMLIPPVLHFFYIKKDADYLLTNLLRELAVFLAHILTKRRLHRRCIDKLNLTLAAFFLLVGKYPYNRLPYPI